MHGDVVGLISSKLIVLPSTGIGTVPSTGTVLPHAVSSLLTQSGFVVLGVVSVDISVVFSLFLTILCRITK